MKCIVSSVQSLELICFLMVHLKFKFYKMRNVYLRVLLMGSCAELLPLETWA